MMRILHVLDHSIPLHSGYTFRTLAILREQRRRGWETLQLTTPKQGPGGVREETVDGLRMLRDAARIRWRFMTERGLDHGKPATAPSPGLSGAVIVVKPQAASAPVQS